MQYLHNDGSKKFPFRLENLSPSGLRQYLEERKVIESSSEFQKEKVTVIPKNLNFISSLRLDESADFILYYIRFRYNGRLFYKIGVTTNSLKQRFGDDFNKIDKILFEGRVIGALKVEQDTLEKFKTKIFPLGILKGGSGYTEFFDEDVLLLDPKK